MDILLYGIEDQIAAVCELAADRDPRLPAQPHQRFHTDGSQIAGDDQIEIPGCAARVLQMGSYGVKCGRGKCQG